MNFQVRMPEGFRDIVIPELNQEKLVFVDKSTVLKDGTAYGVDSTPGPIVLELPEVSSAERAILIKVLNAPNTITVVASGGGTIDGQTALNLLRRYQAVQLFPGPLEWSVGGAFGLEAGTILFGSRQVAAGTATRWLFPSYEDRTAATTVTPYVFQRDTTVSQMRIVHRNPRGNGGIIRYEAMLASTFGGTFNPTGLFVEIQSTAGTGTNAAFDFEFRALQGQFLALRVTKPANVGQSPLICLCSMRAQ